MNTKDFEYVELLEIAVNIGCPGTCLRFCPQEAMLNAYKHKQPRMMSLLNFKKILSTVPKHVFLDFAGLTEPFVNPEFLDMAKFAHEEGYNFGVKTTLIGASVEDVQELAKLNPCCVFVHLPDFINLIPPLTEQYRNALFAGFKYLRNMQLSLMNDYFVTNNREVTVRFQAKKKSGVGQCYRRDHPQMLVFPNGETVICCIDIRMENVVGNLLFDSYSSIRSNFLSRHHYNLCSSCSYNVSYLHYYFRKALRLILPKIIRAPGLWKHKV